MLQKAATAHTCRRVTHHVRKGPLLKAGNIQRGQKHFLCQAVNMLFHAVMLGILKWESMGMKSLLDSASSGY